MPEITKPGPRPLSKYIWLSLGFLTPAAYLCGLWLPLVGPDEPRYAQVAREMFDRGDWITPTLGGYHWFEKPALLYWLEIISYNLFGVNEFAARIGPALFGLGTIAAIWLLGRSIERCSDRDTTYELSNWMALIAASTIGIIGFAHGASFDIIITFPLTAAMVSFFVYDRSRSTAALTAFYVFVGVSLLAKGLIGIVFPYAIVFVYYAVSRRWPSRSFVFSWFWGTALTAAIAALWYVPVYLANGWPFIDEFFIQHHFQRFLSNKYQHPQPFYFFLWVLPLMTMPWFPFAVARLVTRSKDLRSTPASKTDPNRSLLIYAVVWLAVPLVFFSLSGSKLPGYVLPAVPPAAVIAGMFVSEIATRRIWRTTCLAIGSATIVAAIIFTLTVVPQFAREESVRPLVEAANSRSLSSGPIFAVHCIPQGLEFYAPGRVLRGPDGVQKKLYSGPELKAEMERAGVQQALVIVPAVYPDDITVHKFFRTELLATNGELAIYSVELLSSPSQAVH